MFLDSLVFHFNNIALTQCLCLWRFIWYIMLCVYFSEDWLVGARFMLLLHRHTDTTHATHSRTFNIRYVQMERKLWHQIVIQRWNEASNQCIQHACVYKIKSVRVRYNVVQVDWLWVRVMKIDAYINVDGRLEALNHHIFEHKLTIVCK